MARYLITVLFVSTRGEFVDNWGQPSAPVGLYDGPKIDALWNRCEWKDFKFGEIFRGALLNYYTSTSNWAAFRGYDLVPENSHLYEYFNLFHRLIETEETEFMASYDILNHCTGAVGENGIVLGFPPIHVHHVHASPTNTGMQRSRILDCAKLAAGLLAKNENCCSDVMRIVFEQHGDFMCRTAEGGTRCYLEDMPEGYAKRVTESMIINGELNDLAMSGRRFQPEARAYDPIDPLSRGFSDNNAVKQHILTAYDKQSIEAGKQPRLVCHGRTDYETNFSKLAYQFDRRAPTFWSFSMHDPFVVIGFNEHCGPAPGPHEPGVIPATLVSYFG
ncbi:hypothetical protein AURANDRAFT_67468 [Aureococcus anophagefferens]|uniref:Uncharacterized protein n=1 Tax=Aureococcus anophagefferens TaxID=44056 RepID=F0YL95_AURAN|nr:hypothetical protein AURANDRAFT_67468 [Aureococcus anophagefferens]EGB04121.1 hypothetical protein AURANDRAFT_67468 [Aureococcus anophagefferens]|eukprot:XP_009041246.1 hypothetical protein AURANDRAFT_67468 [Aureococcus anophagefferens]